LIETHKNLSGLEAWLRSQTALGKSCRIVDCKKPKTGFSADTLLLTVDVGSAGKRGIVARIDHPDRAVFLDATIGRQALMMRALRQQGIPVPAVIGWTEDAAVLGTPFLIMEQAEGFALPQHPSYHIAGMLLDLDPSGRDRAWRSALSTMARINRVAWQDFQFLLEPGYGEPGLDHYLGWVRAWRQVAYQGYHSIIDPALDWLDAHRPLEMPVELLWGDSNPGNFLFSPDGSVSVALDFEAASIGPAEIDLGWWFVLDRMLAAGNSLPEGMPDKAAQIAIYESVLGRQVRDLAYFEVLAAVRMSLVMANTVQQLIAAGRLPEDNRAGEFNPASLMLAGMIGIQHSDSLEDYMAVVAEMNAR
jgi:aminoglycoside phosphotransferase (APT) family kinase protein